MQKPQLKAILGDFLSQIKSSQALLNKVKSLRMPRIYIEMVTELAFLRLLLAWENFLEESFIRYMVGSKSPSGFCPARTVTPATLRKALEIICGDRQYVEWISASEVIRRAERFFKDGEPYKNALESALTDLSEMNTIRNRIAHRSKSSKEKFSDLVRRKLGYGKQGMTSGRFLLTAKPMTSPQIVFFDDYVKLIETAGRIIVP